MKKSFFLSLLFSCLSLAIGREIRAEPSKCHSLLGDKKKRLELDPLPFKTSVLIDDPSVDAQAYALGIKNALKNSPGIDLLDVYFDQVSDGANSNNSYLRIVFDADRPEMISRVEQMLQQITGLKSVTEMFEYEPDQVIARFLAEYASNDILEVIPRGRSLVVITSAPTLVSDRLPRVYRAFNVQVEAPQRKSVWLE